MLPIDEPYYVTNSSVCARCGAHGYDFDHIPIGNHALKSPI